MAAFEAVERLQKFDWLIQKLHSLRSTFNSEQGIQELQKLHALQLLHRNGIQFNENIGDNDEEPILEEKINNGVEDPEEEDLEDIEEDTEVLDEEEEENDDIGSTPKSEPGQTQTPPTTITNGDGSAAFNLHDNKDVLNVEINDFRIKDNREEESDRNGDTIINHHPQSRFGRFPTGLFPPLPFDKAFDTILGDDPGAGIKVGNFV